MFYCREVTEERERRSDSLWSFPEGMLNPNDSVNSFRVEASNGHAGKVAWASYAVGESYLVVSQRHQLHEAHHVVPAGAVHRISADERTVWLLLSREEVEELPEHHDPPAPVDSWMGRCGRACNCDSGARRRRVLTWASVPE